MKRRIGCIVVLLVLAAAGGFGYWHYSHNPALWQETLARLPEYLPESVRQETGLGTQNDQALTASGFIEVEEVSLAPQISGQVIDMAVGEGDRVTDGQVLVTLDHSRLDADITQAEAAIEAAQAQLDLVQTGPRKEDIAKAESAVLMAEAQVDTADQALQDAKLQRDNQQELDLEIEAARTQVKLDELAIQRSIPQKDAAELADGLAERQVDYVQEKHHVTVNVGPVERSFTFEADEGTKRQASTNWNLKGTQLWQAWISLNEAQTELEASQAYLDSLLEKRANPLALELAVTQAKSGYQEALAAVPVAVANLQVASTGATPEQVAVVRSQLEQAQAGLAALTVQQDKYEIRSPMDGQVIRKVTHTGEVVVEGATLMTLANLDTLNLVVYVAEQDMGRVDLGQPVRIAVDSFPDRSFEGHVVYISDQAEFTPKNVQTKEQRAVIVFAVKIEIPNPEHALKPGMPADATFAE